MICLWAARKYNCDADTITNCMFPMRQMDKFRTVSKEKRSFPSYLTENRYLYRQIERKQGL